MVATLWLLLLIAAAVCIDEEDACDDTWPAPPRVPARTAPPNQIAVYWSELAGWHRKHPSGRVLNERPLIVEFDDFLEPEMVDSLRRIYDYEREVTHAEVSQAQGAKWCIFKREAFGLGLGAHEDYSEHDALERLRKVHEIDFEDEELEDSNDGTLCFTNATRVQEVRRRVPHGTVLQLTTGSAARDHAPSLGRMSSTIEARLGLHSERFSNAREIGLLHYDHGASYGLHQDCQVGDMRSEHNERTVTLLVYLADVVAGGETCFPLLRLNVTPARGKALVMYNLDVEAPSTPGVASRAECLVETQHESVPVALGSTKLLWQQWFRWREAKLEHELEQEKHGIEHESSDVADHQASTAALTLCDPTGSCRESLRRGI